MRATPASASDYDPSLVSAERRGIRKLPCAKIAHVLWHLPGGRGCCKQRRHGTQFLVWSTTYNHAHLPRATGPVVFSVLTLFGLTAAPKPQHAKGTRPILQLITMPCDMSHSRCERHHNEPSSKQQRLQQRQCNDQVSGSPQQRFPRLKLKFSRRRSQLMGRLLQCYSPPYYPPQPHTAWR